MRLRSSVLTSVCLSLFVAVSPVAHAWGPGGHMIVAQVAYDKLTPKAKAEADRLLALPITPATVSAKSPDFVNASNWADSVKRLGGFTETSAEHYVDFAFSIDNTALPATLPGPVNILTALKRNCELLKTSPEDAVRAKALRFIIHYVGDVHQPLHCTARVTADLPKGDEGGNELLVNVAPDPTKNRVLKLHAYWDSGVDEFPKGGAHFAPPKLEAITPAAARAAALQLKFDLQPGNFEAWARESAALARTAAYTDTVDGQTKDLHNNDRISPAYRERAAEIVWSQVAKGGLRLADLINTLLG